MALQAKQRCCDGLTLPVIADSLNTSDSQQHSGVHPASIDGQHASAEGSLCRLPDVTPFTHTGESLAGRAVAIAEGNALGKGPVVFELPPNGIALVRARAAAGDPVFMQLEVRMVM